MMLEDISEIIDRKISSLDDIYKNEASKIIEAKKIQINQMMPQLILMVFVMYQPI